MNLSFALGALLVLVGCGSLPQPLKSIAPEQVDAFEKAAKAQWKVSDQGRQTRQDPVYAQPLNKVEPCRLRTSSDQLARSNLKIYWDGECKNGFAYGFGRDIAISDTHHYEEITYHNGTGRQHGGDTSVFFDFANKAALYVRLISDDRDRVQVAEVFRADERGNPYAVIKRRIEGDTVYEVTRLPKLPLPVTIGYYGEGVAYRYTDLTSVPHASHAGTFEVFELQSRRQSPWTLVADNMGRLHGFESQGGPWQQVSLPEEYAKRILDKAREVQGAEHQMDEAYARAKSMEREYLYGVCENSRQSSGIPQETYTKVCSWMKDNEEAKRTALAAYAAAAEKQAEQASQQASRLTADAARQQREAAGDLSSALADFNRSMAQMRENAERMNRSLEAASPSVPSFGLPSNRVQNCTTISGIRTCR